MERKEEFRKCKRIGRRIQKGVWKREMKNKERRRQGV